MLHFTGSSNMHPGLVYYFKKETRKVNTCAKKMGGLGRTGEMSVGLPWVDCWLPCHRVTACWQVLQVPAKGTASTLGLHYLVEPFHFLLAVHLLFSHFHIAVSAQTKNIKYDFAMNNL